MAKSKCSILVRTLPSSSNSEGMIDVWVDDPHGHEADVSCIEGITHTRARKHQIIILTDPRYDIEEIAEEIRVLLAEKSER